MTNTLNGVLTATSARTIMRQLGWNTTDYRNNDDRFQISAYYDSNDDMTSFMIYDGQEGLKGIHEDGVDCFNLIRNVLDSQV